MSFGIIKNIDTIDHIWGGVTISASGNYICNSQDEALKFAKDDLFISSLSDNSAMVNNGTYDLTSISESIEFLLGRIVKISEQPAFAAKTLSINGSTKKIFKRMCGIQQLLALGDNIILYTIPYTWVKMTGIELIGANNLDKASLYVLDSITGTYSGIPNYTLNQFGNDVNVTKDYHKVSSSYDADLYLGMQIKIVYNSTSIKTIGLNIDLNEVKD